MQQEALLVYLVGDTFSHQQTISGWLHTAIRCSLTYSFPKFMILLSNFRFHGGQHEFKAEGFRALLEIAYGPFFILALVVVLARVAVFRSIPQQESFG